MICLVWPISITLTTNRRPWLKRWHVEGPQVKGVNMSKKSAGGPPHKGMPLTTIFGAVEACHVGPITRHSRGPFPWLPCMRQRGPQFAEKGKTGDWLICRWSLLVNNNQITLHVGPHKLPFLLLVCYCGPCIVWISIYGLRTWMDKERVQMCIRERCRGGAFPPMFG